jgi:hypothetical protein
MALINSRAFKREADLPMAEKYKVAKKDIVRVNDYGQHVVIVAAGQPIPEGLELEKGEAEGAKKAAPVENKADQGRPTPKSAK